MTAQNLLKAARKLNPDDRLLLAKDILKTIEDDTDHFELTDEVKAELLRRQEEHRKNPDAGFTWEQVRREMRPRKK